ncbi:hypothetical protein Pan181_23950 [Aeoliella mucimassa]|uniref:Uncharacterized protein n=1 Tax=Aeoliella mucimassa TaxID=2527972 RepID=A0A518AN93_9BACT|nr:hypothetical protein Pan181_23950 [Aeoliella mucimassa]
MHLDGQYHHELFDLTFTTDAGAAESVRTTGWHKFYRVDDQAWVSAAELNRGDTLEGIDGLLTVESLNRAPGTHRVYNLTVEGEHVYRVASLGALVHNNGCSARKHVAYTAEALDYPGKKYSGRSSGVDMTAEQILAKRKSVHHRNLGPLELDQISDLGSAIRGREQLLKDKFEELGVATEQIQPISPRSKNRNKYIQDAIDEFGDR